MGDHCTILYQTAARNMIKKGLVKKQKTLTKTKQNLFRRYKLKCDGNSTYSQSQGKKSQRPQDKHDRP